MAGFSLPEASRLQGAGLMAAGTAVPGRPMEHEMKVGTILIKDNTLLPEGLRLEAGPGVPGWRVVKDFDGYGLDRTIQKTGWTFFCLAGEVKATVFGIDNQSMLRRAIERILASEKSDGFNSLEITRVASVGSGRFPPVRYVTVSAKWRHIQERPLLLSAEQIGDSSRTRLAAIQTQARGLARAKELASESANGRAAVASGAGT
jgi:hypothetical protein